MWVTESSEIGKGLGGRSCRGGELQNEIGYRFGVTSGVRWQAAAGGLVARLDSPSLSVSRSRQSSRYIQLMAYVSSW